MSKKKDAPSPIEAYLHTKEECLNNPPVGMVDYIVRMKTGVICIIETKGKETEQDRVKKRFLQEWIDAVDRPDRRGKWAIVKSKLSYR